MGKREKILVGLMIAALLYGGFELLFSGFGPTRTDRPEAGLDAARQTAGQISDQIRQAGLEPAQARILELAARQWENDPFYRLPENNTSVNSGRQQSPGAEGLRYSGYLRAGDVKMAIINGVEYSPGDAIKPGGAVVKQIAPEKVVLRFPDAGEQVTVFHTDSQGIPD